MMRDVEARKEEDVVDPLEHASSYVIATPPTEAFDQIHKLVYPVCGEHNIKFLDVLKKRSFMVCPCSRTWNSSYKICRIFCVESEI